MNASNLVGRIVPNYTAGYFGVFNSMIFYAFTCAALIFAFIGLHDAASLITISVLYGFASGACSLAVWPLSL